MQSVCPRCQRVLEYQGDRPSFCAYCGVPLAPGESSAPPRLPGAVSYDADTDPEKTGPSPAPRLDETVEYQPAPAARGAGVGDDVSDQIAGYRLVRRLGSGGMGTVFEAEDHSQGERVAIKVISREHVSSQEAVDRFRQEGRLASAVTHPRCVFVLAVDEYQGRPYIVMELMPGTTLQSLVDKSGPLDPSDAILKVFDVIEGLQEFHKRGLIHRDVKPSNCFLETDGRVKIGDFGLSKSLDGGTNLTRSGTFIGTPLYASPEQIKRDELDERTDVYSVAATLYYLLTGRPPVQAKDAAEALARIVSEPAPPLRNFRPDLPRALEAVIQRGLERDPARRWRDLQEFHNALAPFVPDRLSIASIGLRIGAYLVDVGAAYVVSWAIFGLVMLYHQNQVMATVGFYERNSRALGWMERALWFLYFALLEGIGGATLGKWLAGLRVSRADRGGPPGLGRGLVRAMLFYGLTELPADAFAELAPPVQGARMFLTFWAYERVARGLGMLSLLLTMRAKSGFRGPHEWLSGTRVVRVARGRKPAPTRRFQLLAGSRLLSDLSLPAPGTLSHVGPYTVRAAVRLEHKNQVLLGQDSTLQRPVWIVLRSAGASPPSPARRALKRQARPRWIGGGDESGSRWDAFTAPSGFPLSEFVKSEGLPWRDVLRILRELAEELQSACADVTMPASLSTSQVWIQRDGSMQLIDFLDEDADAGVEDDAEHRSNGNGQTAAGSEAADPPRPRLIEWEQRRALNFLGEVARLALEGRPAHPGDSEDGALSRVRSALGLASREIPPKPPAAWGRPVRAAVPERARPLLDRLTGVRPPYSSLAVLASELELAASRPVEVSRLRRAAHLAIQGFFLLPGLALMFVLAGGVFPHGAFPWEMETIIALPLAWIAFAMIMKGGLSFSLAGISMIRTDGRPNRLAYGLRALLVWAPPTLLLVLAVSLRVNNAGTMVEARGCWIGALALLAAYVALALAFPVRCVQDRIAGTVLVPL